MHKCKLTHKLIDSAVCTKGQFIDYQDTQAPNLYLRISHTGGKVFSFLYKFKGRQHRITMGDVTVLSLEKARETACDYKLMLYQGINPKTTIPRYMLDVAHTENLLLQDAIGHFLHAKQDLRSLKHYVRALNKIPPIYLECPVHQITRKSIRTIAQNINRKHGACASNYFIRVVKSLFSWLEAMDLIETNTLSQLKELYKENPCERVLEDDELRMIWHQAEQEGYPFGTCIQMLILTGQRKSEVAKIEWRDIDFKHAIWTIPPSKTKNKKIHKVPLSDACMRLLKFCPKTSTFVFSTNHKSPISGFTKPMNRIRDDIHIPHWTLHDIRRTFATNLAKNHDVLETIISYILNHSVHNITKRYNKHPYLTHQREALQQYAEWVMDLVSQQTATNSKGDSV